MGHSRGVFKSYWQLLAAFAIYSFILTLRSPLDLQVNPSLFFVLNYGGIAIVILLFWAILVRRPPVPFERLLQLLLSIFAVGFVLLPFMQGVMSPIPSVLFFIATALIYMMVWMAVIDLGQRSSAHPYLLISAWGACYGCPRILYLFIRAYLPGLEANGIASLAISMLSLFSLFVALILLSGKRPAGVMPFFSRLQNAQPLSDELSDGDAPWERLAHEYHLTPREEEVFELLFKGHSRSYISESLFISENTVKAHTKNIYRKLGIHSRHELEKIIDT